MALLTSSLPKQGRRPVLAGGSAVEVYLDGTLRTGGMDVVYNVKSLREALKAWRFSLGGGLRAWANEELGLAVGTVGDRLEGSYERVMTVTTDYGPATVIGIEDLIVKRLGSAKHGGAPTDMDHAYLLAKSQGDRIDWPYLQEEAEGAHVGDYLAKLKTLLAKGTG